MTTACTGSAIYWGEGGEYGPFDEQQTGEWARWPDFGQVLRYFREKAELSPKEFVEIYGRSATKDGGPISERQLRRMENQNQVPADMNKRKLIAHLLNIPPRFSVSLYLNMSHSNRTQRSQEPPEEPDKPKSFRS